VYNFRQTCKRRSQIPLNLTLTIALTLLTLMVTVSVNPNPTTKYRCELDMCCLTWYKNLGLLFTGYFLLSACVDMLHTWSFFIKPVNLLYLSYSIGLPQLIEACVRKSGLWRPLTVRFFPAVCSQFVRISFCMCLCMAVCVVFLFCSCSVNYI